MKRLLICALLAWAVAGAAPAAPGPTVDQRLAALPLTATPAAGRGDTLAVVYSGDGGWSAIDRGIAADLVRAGTPVVGYDSLRYFMVRKAPQEAAADLTVVLRRYMAEWGKSRIILAGYSFGADALPAIVPLLPADLKARIRVVALVGVGATGDLQFQPGEWFGHLTDSAYPIAPALARMRGSPVVCIYGDSDAHAACPTLPPAAVRQIRLGGDHHFNGAFDQVGAAILRAAGL